MSSPSSAGSTPAEATPDRPKWGTRLTSDMREKLAAAREALGTDSVAKLMTATGASRSNVGTLRRSTDAPVKLGRPTFFFTRGRGLYCDVHGCLDEERRLSHL